jgi:D-threo-aldose 1-dehydrogenase
MAETATVPVGLGAANVGNLYRSMSDDEAAAVLEAAWDSGVRSFDTAPHYGLGLSERRLGAFLRAKPRSEFTVSTKVGRLLRPDPAWAGGLDDANDFIVPADQRRVWDFSADGLLQSLEESLARLGLDHVDAVYLHDPERHDLARGLDEGLRSLVALRERGLVAEVGVGSMDIGTLAAFAATGALDRLMVAGRYTLADQSAAEDVLPACRTHGVRVIAAAVFNSGLLATDRPGPDALFDYGSAPPEVLDRVTRIAAVCRELDVALPVAAVQFPLRDPAVVGVVAGAATPEQVRANVAAAQAVVPDALWDRLRTEGLVR